MGKSAISCFKMITCATDSIENENEDLQPIENEPTRSKRRWSFRKRSASHRVLSNSVNSELPSPGNKESPEATSLDYHPQTNFPTTEKVSEPQLTDEKPPPLSAEKDIKGPVTLISAGIVDDVDHNLQESSAILIQAAIRAYLAQRELRKIKSVVRLQAAVRRHLVQRQAVGTLRCVQAIVKMQTLVRARRSRILEEKFTNQENIDGSHQTSTLEYSGTGVNKTSSSTHKLIANGFARQLLESAPKTKPIYISCDPSEPDSAWKWLERWMAVSSSDIEQQHKLQICPAYHGEVDNNTPAATEVSTEVLHDFSSASADAKCVSEAVRESHDNEHESTISHDDVFDFQVPPQMSVSEKDSYSSAKDEVEEPKNDVEEPKNDVEGLVMAQEISTNTEELLNEASDPPPVQINTEDHVVEKPDSEHDNSKPTSETMETEGKKFTFGLRKACNPAFAAAQSKFEELSSMPTSATSINSTSHNPPEESKSEVFPSQSESVKQTDSFSVLENSISNDQRIQVGGSECGTEISISSTLDSPDRSVIEDGEIVLEIGDAMQENYNSAAASRDAYNPGSLQVGSENKSSLDSHKMPPDSGFLPLEEPEEVEKNPPGVVMPDEESASSDTKVQVEGAAETQAYRSSPEGSPRSRVTTTDLFGTPSSQTSSSAKRNKTNNSVPTRKKRSHVMAERSPSNLKSDSGARSSTEHLPKEKIEKRRNSFGMSKPDHADNEPRVSNSNSLPNYMQATESAKAKVHANNSPKASPDLQDKDNYMKKRHSLPTGNGKQESSPRMQRSSSQAQQNGKGSAAQSPHNPPERKWQR
ncbi:Protein IQ-DOMAIN 32 [Acorus calamus]|uniref:Protein IQ-DOMAIN 32 n=1 Tax=Acorus calamus TaxID=4465 RepID=A0AAV9F5Y0_ACOCL|nr:Protein IQ-DOMAIN 32 [Acorus calamus]